MKQKTQNIITLLFGLILGTGTGYILKGRWVTGLAIACFSMLFYPIFAYGRLFETFAGFVFFLIILGVIWVVSAITAAQLDQPIDKWWKIILGMFVIGIAGALLYFMITEPIYQTRYDLRYWTGAEGSSKTLQTHDVFLFRYQDKDTIPLQTANVFVTDNNSGDEVFLNSQTYLDSARYLTPIGVPLYIIYSSDFNRIGMRLDRDPQQQVE